MNRYQYMIIFKCETALESEPKIVNQKLLVKMVKNNTLMRINVFKWTRKCENNDLRDLPKFVKKGNIRREIWPNGNSFLTSSCQPWIHSSWRFLKLTYCSMVSYIRYKPNTARQVRSSSLVHDKLYVLIRVVVLHWKTLLVLRALQLFILYLPKQPVRM